MKNGVGNIVFEGSIYEAGRSSYKAYSIQSIGLKDGCIILNIELEKVLNNLNYSADESGKPKYWHVVLFRDREGKMTQMLLKPTIQEINMEQYRI